MTPSSLVTEHLPLVRTIAVGVKRAVPFADMDDLEGYGCLGLLKAERSFDPRRGTTFTSWAFTLIRGAMLDGIRVMSGGASLVGNGHATRVGPGILGTLVAEVESPEDAIDRQREAAEVREAIAQLPERERRLVEAVDLREERLTDAAVGVGLSKSRASRVRAGAIEELRSMLS